MSSEKFCLRWNDFESNISSAFRELRDDKDFFDVTLACDDEQIQAHKVILSACSQFFRNVLRRNPHQHPLLYLKGVKFTDLQSVLNFMYHGEVNVAQEELNSFLAVAEDLRVKGLTQNQSGPSKRETFSLPKPPPIIKQTPKATERDPIQPLKRPRPTPVISSIPDDDDIQEVVPVKTEPREAAAAPPPPQPIAPAPEQFYSPQIGTQALAPADDQMVEYQDESYEDYGDYSAEHQGYEGAVGEGQGSDGAKVFLTHDKIDAYIQEQTVCQVDSTNGSKYWNCGICQKYLYKKQDLTRHIESFHVETTPYFCSLCDAQFNTRRACKRHTLSSHNRS